MGKEDDVYRHSIYSGYLAVPHISAGLIVNTYNYKQQNKETLPIRRTSNTDVKLMSRITVEIKEFYGIHANHYKCGIPVKIQTTATQK